MIAALQSAYGRIYEALTKITPASWIFNWLGSLIVAKPEDMKQAPDFWLDNEDRDLPSAKDYGIPAIQMEQVGSEHFRRHLRKDLAVFTMLVCMVLSTAIYIVGLLAIWMFKPDLEQSGQVPVVSSSQTQPAGPAQPAPRRATVRAPAKAPEVSQEICRQLRDDLEQQRTALTTPSTYDTFEACRARGFL
jgi:hypothetical protein